MLSLSVKEGDYVLIGDDIRVHVQKSVGGNMKLGIDAPKTLAILRGEVYERNLMADPWQNLDELEANRRIKEDFKKDTQRYSKKRESAGAARNAAAKGNIPRR